MFSSTDRLHALLGLAVPCRPHAATRRVRGNSVGITHLRGDMSPVITVPDEPARRVPPLRLIDAVDNCEAVIFVRASLRRLLVVSAVTASIWRDSHDVGGRMEYDELKALTLCASFRLYTGLELWFCNARDGSSLSLYNNLKLCHL